MVYPDEHMHACISLSLTLKGNIATNSAPCQVIM